MNKHRTGHSPRFTKVVILSSFLFLAHGGAAPVQLPNTDSPAILTPLRGRSSDVPLPILYRHFFAHMRQLDREAAQMDRMDKSGNNGRKYRRYYQQRLGFSDAQFSYVRHAAQDTQKTDEIDQQAQEIIANFRSQIAHGSTSGDGSMPPVPQKLRDLKKQRDEILSSQIAQLKQQLGPKASAEMDSLVLSTFTTHLGIKPVGSSITRGQKHRNLDLPSLSNVAAGKSTTQ